MSRLCTCLVQPTSYSLIDLGALHAAGAVATPRKGTDMPSHAHHGYRLDPALRFQPGQSALTSAQEAEARRFVDERIQAQLSTELVDEQAVEAFLRHAYQVAKLESPKRIHWLDGPLQLFAVLTLPSVGDSVRPSLRPSVWAYDDASRLAFYHFFDVYLAPNDLHALAHFKELVSGYWLGQDVAVVVQRPKVLARDREGRLHSATGKCIKYHDGWGFSAWHGVRVPEQAIRQPETLTREDFLNESNMEVRRVMQERMGERFVSELGGVVIDTSPRSTLYEVALPDDPERVARYVQVQDASSERQYFLRVPPTIQTAGEAVAWTFQLKGAGYHPTQET